MDALDTMVLLSLVKPHGRGWPLKLAIATRLAQLRGGGDCSGPIAAEWTGADEVQCRRALLGLEQAKIIRRDAGDTGRAHIRWCAISDDWRRWRVEWLLDPTQIPAQLAFATQQREESPLSRVIARSYSARSIARIARSFDARSWVEEMEEVAGIARQGSARSSTDVRTDRALKNRAILGRRRAFLERAILGSGPQSVPSAGDGEKNSATGSIEPQQQRVIDDATRKLKSKVLAAAIPAPGRSEKFLNGPPLHRLLDLVDEHGAQAVDDALGRVEAGTMSPVLLVDALADAIHSGPAEVEAIDVDARVSHLRRMIATHEAAGAEPPQSLVDELVRWQTDGEPQEAMAR